MDDLERAVVQVVPFQVEVALSLLVGALHLEPADELVPSVVVAEVWDWHQEVEQGYRPLMLLADELVELPAPRSELELLASGARPFERQFALVGKEPLASRSLQQAFHPDPPL